MSDLDQQRQTHFLQLESLNQRFYQRYASSFHQTRSYGWPGWRMLLECIPQRPLTVYDIACGNGRLIEFLEHVWCGDHHEFVEKYLGVDRDAGLLAYAQERSPSFPCHWASFNWAHAEDPPTHLIQEGADWVTLFGVLHHVYSFSARVALICWAAQCLKPHGVLSVSLWDFGAQNRYQQKTLEWRDYIEEGLDPQLIEEGDMLLGWRGETHTPRYCHWMSRSEESQWLEAIASHCPWLSRPQLTLHPRDGNRYWSWTRA